MRSVEERFGKPLEELIPELYRSMTQAELARHVGVDPATMNRWFLVFGIPTSHRKAVSVVHDAGDGNRLVAPAASPVATSMGSSS